MPFLILKFRSNFIFICIILVALFLRFDRLSTLMSFYGDQAWFYLSARDLALFHNIPLVGITSSHTWLHQGPLWTYMLAIVLAISNFNPLSGAVLTSLIGVICIFLVYKIGNEFFSKSFALIASALYATSPLIVVHSRMAYHTSPIPLVVLFLLYSLLKIINGNSKFLILTALCISLLYNLELATVVFIPIIFLVLCFGFYKKEKWFKKLKNRKIVYLSVLALVIPMIPVLIYDSSHGYPQTIKYVAWFGYKFLVLLGFLKAHGPSNSYSEVFNFFLLRSQLLYFGYNFYIAVLILLSSIAYIGFLAYKKVNPQTLIIFLFTVIPLIGYFLSKTTSEAYIPMLFAGLIFSFALLLRAIHRKFRAVGVCLAIIIVATNFFYIFTNNYLIGKNYGYGLPVVTQEKALNFINKESRGESFSIKVATDKFATAISPYEYLSWYYGFNLSLDSHTKYLIYEYPNYIKVINLSNGRSKIVQ